MLADWIKMQESCHAQVYQLESEGKNTLFEVVTVEPASYETRWEEARSVFYHVFDGDEWVIATPNYREAYSIFEGRCKEDSYEN